MDLEKLRAAVRGRVFVDEETLAEVETDFGRIVRKKPGAVVLPQDSDDVRAVIRLANLENLSVTVRGSGHTQGGQCLSDGGIVIDTGSLRWMDAPEGLSVRVGSGLPWSDLLRELVPRGLIPPVWIHYLDQTVGGTISTGGLGITSHRHGSLSDNLLELEVVIGAGEKVFCSPDANSDLFECMRSGLGQFGVITAARLRLRPAKSRVRTWYLLYDDLGELLRDQEKLIRDDRLDAVESWATPLPQGFRKVGAAAIPFAEWFFPMQLSWEYEDPFDEQPLLRELGAYRRSRCEEDSLPDFLFRMEPVYEQWRQSGTWRFAHPWMEVLLPWAAAGSYVQGVLKDFPPSLLTGGQVRLAPLRTSLLGAPLLIKPEGELVMGFGLLPAVPRQQLPLILPILKKAGELGMRVGGKRVLSSWIEFEPKQWRRHFGPQWGRLLQWKRFFDPAGVLNASFIDYSDSGSGTPNVVSF